MVLLDGRVTILAGTGNAGFSGNSEAAIDAELQEPGGMILGSDGALFIGETENARVRKVCL